MQVVNSGQLCTAVVDSLVVRDIRFLFFHAKRYYRDSVFRKHNRPSVAASSS